MSRLHNGMQASQLPGITWRKSSRSGPTGGNCVEIAPLPHGTPGGVVAVRDSRQQDGHALIFTATAWQAFTGGLRIWA